MAIEAHQPLRVLLMADSHLGFDLPTHPRVERRRRGHDFLANHRLALRTALKEQVDLVVHGGDLFHRPHVPPSLVFQAFQPLLEVAEVGIPVFLTPGNHERSRIPHDRFGIHPNLHIFREPGTVRLEVHGVRVALSGFPYRRKIREAFPAILRETGWDRERADLRFLCMHHCVEGATVGPADFTFRSNPDVICGMEIPGGFAAVLSGHIHRHQVLRKDLQTRPLKTPVFYPGSVERTAFAEASEAKGFLILKAIPGPDGGQLLGHEFVHLPARPMEVLHLAPEEGPGGEWAPGELVERLREKLSNAPPDSVFQLRVDGHLPSSERHEISAATLRKVIPRHMNVQLTLEQDRVLRGRSRVRSGSVDPRQKGEKETSLPLQHRLAI